MLAALITEVVMTMMFVFVILGATDSRAPKGFAPIAIGLCLGGMIGAVFYRIVGSEDQP